jgi:hypothetical protein
LRAYRSVPQARLGSKPNDITVGGASARITLLAGARAPLLLQQCQSAVEIPILAIDVARAL